MDPERINDLANDLYADVFVLLDYEDGVDSMDAGAVATKVEEAFRVAMTALYGTDRE